ncbi:head-tail connector protein [Sporomusa sp. KB1]|jgi:hypothetical protein|uniref:head-tail connector protein n=1 Tax=Sporomusa sp. KB1 TaxID=943346 RepID=UPI0011A58A06|nr:head-tail connector protein [Sporomusa sp. KB1]TWH49598.1 gp6-like head-tail connector protein [Sporomusa sp. KB1]
MLLDEIKDYLRITGNDEDTILENTILRGRTHLEGLTGTTLDFESEGLAKSLLFDYCRYAYNNASEYFEENFAGAILRLQLQSAVMELENQN